VTLLHFSNIEHGIHIYGVYTRPTVLWNIMKLNPSHPPQSPP
jgi:hypothetical protein